MSQKKPNNRYGVIDLGTNTFHLLIAEIDSDGKVFKKIFTQRVFVLLGRDGRKSIGAEAFNMALDTISVFVEHMKKEGVQQIRVVGTEFLRRAENAALFVGEVQTLFGIRIEIIDGQREAELIYKGVIASGFALNPSHIIMDIGGGSNEFIIGDERKIHWSQSFRSGITTLRQSIKRKDPPSQADITDYMRFIENASRALHIVPSLGFVPKSIIGTAGPFEVLYSLIDERVSKDFEKVLSSDFNALFSHVLSLPYDERKSLRGMPPDRADLIIESFVLIKYVIDLFDIEEILVSRNSIKEGIIFEMI